MTNVRHTNIFCQCAALHSLAINQKSHPDLALPEKTTQSRILP